jgi:hypothetical protein
MHNVVGIFLVYVKIREKKNNTLGVTDSTGNVLVV